MATRVSLKEADELSKRYLEQGFVAFSWDLKNFFVSFDELPKGPSKTIFYQEGYYVQMIERLEGYAVVIRYDRDEPENVRDGIRGIERIAAGTYGLSDKDFPQHTSHPYIDLGLPSGLCWAKDDIFNVTWGEVILGKASKAKKNVEKRSKETDIKANPAMDAARYNWGGKWRMPSESDFQELLDCCQWKWRKFGFLVTGPNGNTIFLRCRGYWTSTSREGEDTALAFAVQKNVRSFETCPSTYFFPVLPVFSEDDVESAVVERIKIVKKGAVKILGGRMSYTISYDEVLTVKGDLRYGREEYSLFPIKQDDDRPWSHLVVEEGVTEIGNYLFYRAYPDTVKLPGSLKSIGAWAFADNRYMESVQFPAGLKVIGVCAFYRCTGLKEVVIPEGVEEIRAQAFMDCEGLEKVVLPSTLKTIGKDAFEDCENLKEIVLPEGLESIGRSAFHKTAVTEVTVPASVKSIGEGAFYLCSALSKVVLNEGLESIGDSAFSRTAITEVTIPKSVKSFSLKAFDESVNVIEPLKSLYYILVDQLYKSESTRVLGRGYRSACPPDADTAETEARKALASGLRDSAQYMDWREDCEFGHTVPFYKFIDCAGDKYAVVPAKDPDSKEGLDDNGFIIDEELYKKLASEVRQWIELK